MSTDNVEIPGLEGDDAVIGIHTGTRIEQQKVHKLSINVDYCVNCKQNIHCFIKVDCTTKESIIQDTCTDLFCECKCRTHYVCSQCAYLHPHNSNCNRQEEKYITYPKTDALIDKINKEFQESRKDVKVGIL